MNQQNENKGLSPRILQGILFVLILFNVFLFLFLQKKKESSDKTEVQVPLEGRSFQSAPGMKDNSQREGEKSLASLMASAITTVKTASVKKKNPVTHTTLLPDKDGYLQLGFDVLAGYIYEGNGKFPEKIQKLNGKKVSIIGFTMPLEMTEDRKVKTSLLIKDPPACCFGKQPKINDWVYLRVDLDRASIPLWSNSAFRVKGIFKLGEDHQGGELISVYQLKAVSVQEVHVETPWWTIQ